MNAPPGRVSLDQKELEDLVRFVLEEATQQQVDQDHRHENIEKQGVEPAHGL